MGFLDKVKFWKKDEDEFELGNDLGLPKDSKEPMALPGEGEQEFGLGPSPGAPGALGDKPMGGGPEPQLGMPPREPRITPAIQPQTPPMTGHRDMEVINLKLDAIRTTLETMNIRLERIERIAKGEEHPPKQW